MPVLGDARGRADTAGLDRADADRLGGLLLMLGWPALIWAGTLVAIPVPPHSVPATLQLLAVLLASLALGPRLGVGALVIYLGAGALGLAWFSDGRAGLDVLLGRTGGFLLGFGLVQPLIARIARTRDAGGAIKLRGWWSPLVATLAATALIYLVGWTWFHVARVRETAGAPDPHTLADTLAYIAYPFVVIDLAKAGVAGVLGVWLTRHSIRRGW